MLKYKNFLLSQLERVKSTASQLIEAKDDAHVVELQPEAYERAREWAAYHHTSVQAVVNDVMDRCLMSCQSDSIRFIPPERQERNPLLLLDGLCKREL